MAVYDISIIGVGQLGSRHLQGLVSSTNKFNIWLVDPSQSSLDLAKSRLEEVDNSFVNAINYCNDINSLPADLDLAIVATTANHRRNVIEQLLKTVNVNYMVLEKIVFQSLDDFGFAEKLFEESNIDAWVNCPRRLYPYYSELKKQIAESVINITVTGNNWGLACNSIHFIDLLYYLSNDSSGINFNNTGFKNTALTSKRTGFYELYGVFSGTTCSGNAIKLVDDNSQAGSNLEIIIEYNNVKLTIDEVQQEVKEFKNDIQSEIRFDVRYQSELTGIVVDQILQTGQSSLTPLSECGIYHRPMLESFNDHFSKIFKQKIEICPIT